MELGIRNKWQMPKFLFDGECDYRRAFVTCAGVTGAAALPQELRM